MTERPTPSLIVPYIVALLTCDAASVDPSTGKKSLIGIFDRIVVRSFPSSRPMTLYVRMTDAEGHYEFEVRFVKAKTGEVLADARGQATIGDRLAVADVAVPWPPLPIPEEGRYEFQVWANSMFLGVASITVALAEGI